MPRSERPRRAAFTLVELLVVAILVVLLGLLSSAVQRARMAAAKVTSASNLKQLVLAVHHYESTYHHLPWGLAIEGQTFGGAHMVLLPYCENNTRIFRCPADPSYNTDADTETYTSCLSNGNIFNIAYYTLAKLRPGTANVIAFGPRYMDCDRVPTCWRSAILRNVNAAYFYPEPSTATQFDVPPRECVGTGFSTGLRAAPFGSCDGSVRAYGPGADLRIFQAASDPNSGAPITWPD
jgi:hypothetical protein